MELKSVKNVLDYYHNGVIIYQTPEEVGVLTDELKRIKESGIEGDMAEVGVFQGGTASIMNETLPNKALYLFDTFEGFADELHESDPKHYKVGHCATPLKFVDELFRGKEGVFITVGKFPDTGDIIKDKKFAFVHIDVDIYTPTKNALEFFLPRMVKGGSILIHDYPVHTGVKKAVEEVMSGPITAPSLRQGLIRINA